MDLENLYMDVENQHVATLAGDYAPHTPHLGASGAQNRWVYICDGHFARHGGRFSKRGSRLFDVERLI